MKISVITALYHISFLSKLTENKRVVKLRLTEYPSNNNLLNLFQSAYIKHTQTALLSVHDHIIKAMSHQQVICLTLVDLSAAFDTIDHTILFERFSAWFAITSFALSWVKSYVLNRSFYVSIEDSVSSVYQILYGIPQGSVLCRRLFILYTIPLSTVLSNSSANHYLYADDTQLYLSFILSGWFFEQHHSSWNCYFKCFQLDVNQFSNNCHWPSTVTLYAQLSYNSSTKQCHTHTCCLCSQPWCHPWQTSFFFSTHFIYL